MRFFKVLFFISLLVSVFYSQTFKFSPETPKPDQTVKVSYDPGTTVLSVVDNVDLQYFVITKEKYFVESTELKKDGNNWIGELKIPGQALMLLCIFQNSEELKDEKNFLVYLKIDRQLSPDEENVVLKTKYMIAEGQLRAEIDYSNAYKELSTFVSKNPGFKRENIPSMLNFLSKADKEKHKSELPSNLEFLEKQNDLKANELMFLSQNYNSINPEKAKAFKEKADQLPKTDETMEVYNNFRGMKEMAKKLELLENLNKYKLQPSFKSYLVGNILSELLSTDMEKFTTYYNSLKDSLSSTQLNSIAWDIYEKTDKIDLATKVAEFGIEKIKTDKSLKPDYVSTKEFNQGIKNSTAAIYDTYSRILEKTGKIKEALDAQKIAVSNNNFSDEAMNENYFELLNKNNQLDNGKTELENCVKEGNFTEKMKDLLKVTYKNEADFENYFNNLVKVSKDKTLKITRAKMTSQPAPDFKLKDLAGNDVSLSELKGKIVILDFWATWCGPCKSSFPSIQRAVKMYESDPDVKFLFINTWERVQDKKKNAESFINQNKYTFHVLLDDQNEVVGKYKVSGIPTKFFIDKEGNIRLQSVGFGGESHFFKELEAIIQLLK